MYERKENWECLMAETIKSFADKSFEWGTRDCAQLVIAHVHNMTGRNLQEELEIDYSSPRGAFTYLRDRFGSLEAAAAFVFGPGIPPFQAQRGDIMLGPFFSGEHTPEDPLDTETFGVCVGRKCVTVGDEQLNFWPISKARIAWHV